MSRNVLLSVECEALEDINGGGVEFTSVSGLMTVVEYTCNVGYTLVGTASLACSTDGSWNGSAPHCRKYTLTTLY